MAHNSACVLPFRPVLSDSRNTKLSEKETPAPRLVSYTSLVTVAGTLMAVFALGAQAAPPMLDPSSGPPTALALNGVLYMTAIWAVRRIVKVVENAADVYTEHKQAEKVHWADLRTLLKDKQA